MDDRQERLLGRIIGTLFSGAVWLFSLVLMFWSFFSLGDEPIKAVALAVESIPFFVEI